MTSPAELGEVLRSVMRGRVFDDDRRRAEYSSDASNYRVVPQVVVEPRDEDDVAAALEVCRTRGVPFTSRGGGTSIAGNAIGTGVVADFSRCMNAILDLDAEHRTAVVQPGVVLADLQRAAAVHGLRFGPDPSSASRATIGGMIGNNACGAHAVAYGRTADNVLAITGLTGNGRRIVAAQGVAPIEGLSDAVSASLDVLRTEFGRFSRQGSGYLLEHLLPERGQHLARAIVGSEGTLLVTLEATLRLVPISPVRVLVVLGYADMPSAADAVPAVLGHAPLAVEGIDARLVGLLRHHRGPARVPDLPAGDGWLMVEIGGDDESAARLAAQAVIGDACALDATVLPSGAEASALWRIREDAAGLAGRAPEGRPAWPGWEDVAVPPDRLGAYLREFDALLQAHRLHGLPYGHFGDGCIHTRIDFPLDDDPAAFRAFLLDASRLAIGYGGSCSGEHGDGRARSELLPLMYSDRALALFAQVKRLFDPANVLNPDVLVDPAPLDRDLRRPQAHPIAAAGGYSFANDGGDFTKAVHRCVGVGKCRADTTSIGGFMCPSFLATRDEKDTTRGRARVLQELTNGSLVTGWTADEVAESLDLCISCKACSSDCPAGVDVAQYRSEVLHRRYRHRVRPRVHYSLGWLPFWLAAVSRAPGAARAVNAMSRSATVRRALAAAAGIDRRRDLPRLAEKPFSAKRFAGQSGAPTVALWVDTFTRSFAPEIVDAALRVLERAGHRVLLAPDRACCGLTYISTGQLTLAKRRLTHLLDLLEPLVDRGLPVIGLEPSCTATLRSDLLDLLPGDPRAARVGGAVRTLAEVLSDGSGLPDFDLRGHELVVQPHCHQHAVMGFDTDRALLESAGAALRTVGGCCGLAGNWGMEQGHYAVSVAIAEHSLIPAVEGSPAALIGADGFSCRTQIEQLTGRRALHLAQILDEARGRADPVGGR